MNPWIEAIQTLAFAGCCIAFATRQRRRAGTSQEASICRRCGAAVDAAERFGAVCTRCVPACRRDALVVLSLLSASAIVVGILLIGRAWLTLHVRQQFPWVALIPIVSLEVALVGGVALAWSHLRAVGGESA